MRIRIALLERDRVLTAELAQVFGARETSFVYERLPCARVVSTSHLRALDPNRLSDDDSAFDLTLFCCTSASIVCGAIERPASFHTAFGCVRRWLAAANAHGVHLVVPYTSELRARVMAHLRDSGIRVHGWHSFAEPDGEAVARIPTTRLERAISSFNTQVCDVVFVCCTNFACMHVIPEWESRYGMRIVSSNRAIAWDIARALEESERLAGAPPTVTVPSEPLLRRAPRPPAPVRQLATVRVAARSVAP